MDRRNMNLLSVRMERADSLQHFGVDVDCLAQDETGKVEKFGAEVRVDFRLKDAPSRYIGPAFRELKKEWEENSSTPSTFISALQTLCGVIIDSPKPEHRGKHVG